MMKNKIILITLMSGFVSMQAVESDAAFKLKVGVGIAATTAVAGVAIWRLTAPTDKKVLNDVAVIVKKNQLNQYYPLDGFDFAPREGEQETQLEVNLAKLNKYSVLTPPAIFDQRFNIDAQELKKLQDSMWFRSFFNTDVSEMHKNLGECRANAMKLQSYFRKHDDFFKAQNLLEEYKQIEAKIFNEVVDVHTFIRAIRKHHLLGKAYPLVYFVSKLVEDISWVENFKKGVYPKLDAGLKKFDDVTRAYAVDVKNHEEYQKEEMRAANEVTHLLHDEKIKAETLLAKAQTDNVYAQTQALNASHMHKR